MVFPLRVQDHLMKPSQVLLAHSVHVFTEAPSRKRAVLCHTHVLTNLHLVPIAKLTHTPHGFGRSALHWMDQTAASIAHSSPLLHVLVWGYVLVYIQGYCCSVNRQIWWLRWQSWPDEDIYSSSMCGCRNEWNPPNSGFIG